ncbi:acetamidase/formamidase family protein [Pseudooceanicola sp. 502str34]|uniref:acetamidase/formamidase family protein n=1 Tax=Maritimibacter alkaliphilus TaxID=404236 RepID=UPI001C95F892|nr:acetamidase/formamidase family protein [Maritimibacter alkaliphilus]MBY6090841.1 acetamidase/formamidase family protein [Maritimibacter alkaliphilus]
MTDHSLSATPDTVHWGRFWSDLPPVKEIDAGDRIVIETLSGKEEVLPSPESGLTVTDTHRAILAADLPRVAHLLTGPVAIKGAMPGDVLKITIEKIDLGADWGFNIVRPTAGTLPGEFPVSGKATTVIPIDRAAKTGKLPWGATLPLEPFFGVMGVAPPPEWGELASTQPRLHGGNMDLKLLTEGSVLYLPVHVEGGLFSCGDGHGCQGDGEVCITALETALTGTFTFDVLKKGETPIDFPRAETAEEIISMGFHASLDTALQIALRQMIAMIREHVDITETEAYQLCSLAADFAVTQSVNQEKGVHGRLRKALLKRG